MQALKTMGKKGIGFLGGWLISLLTLGQTVEVLDAKNEPVSEVFIYHDKRSYTAFTNDNGKADISHFPQTGYFHFQHPSFEDKRVLADSLRAESFRITLKEKLVWFNEVVISANKWEQDEKDLSQQILSVERKSISFNNPTTSADLLNQSGQVFVQKSQLGGGSPKLRGFSANAVLLVVDGVRMNNAIYRGGNLQNVINIDPNAVASSEVVFGPGSVLYGSDALGGVMDFHTVDPAWNQNGTKVDGNLMTRWSSAANERTGHFDLSLSRRKFTYFGSITGTWMDDLKAGSNRSDKYEGHFLRPNYVDRINGEDQLVNNDDPNLQVGSGFDLFNAVQKFKFLLNQHSEISYSFYFGTTSNIPRYDRLVITKPGTDSLEHGAWYYGAQTWQMHSLRFNHYDKRKLFDQARITAAFQRYEESRNDRDFGDDRLRTRTEMVDVYSMNIDLDKELPKGDLFYGFEMVHNEVASSGYRENLVTGQRTDVETRYPDNGSQFTSVAAYANWVTRLSDKWTLNFGGRYNFVKLTGSRSSDNSSVLDFSEINLQTGALNGSAGLVYLPTEKTKFGFNFSTGFRSPNVDDVGKVFEFDEDENGQPIILVPNEYLKPEYAYNSEVSMSTKFGPVTLNVVGFYTTLNNPILRGDFQVNGQSTVFLDDDGDASTPDVEHGVVAQINGNQAFIYGGSVQARVRVSEVISGYGTASFSDGEESSGEPLRHTTPLFGRAGLTWNKEDHRIDFYAEFNGPRWRDDIPAAEIEDKPYLYTDEGSPGWITFNLKTSFVVNDFLTLDAGVENIFDVHYRPYSSGISAPGRNFIIALRGSF